MNIMLTGPIDLIKKSVKIFFLKKNFFYFLKIYTVFFVTALISFVIGRQFGSSQNPQEMYKNWFTSGNLPVISVVAVWFILAFLVNLWAQVASYEAVKRSVSGGLLDFKDTYRTAWKYLAKFFVANFLVGLIVVVGFILLIVPGIIFGVWYSFTLWEVVEKNQTALNALKESKRIVKGKFWKVLGRSFAFALFGMLVQLIFAIIPFGYGSLLSPFVGGLILMPFYLLFKELEAQS
jgi:ABC-type Fe3+ transport system permease subunit